MDIILAGSTPGGPAAKSATSAIPIILVTTGDPVGEGLIQSLARPGGNVTGITALGQALHAKRLELLKDAIPRLSRVAVLANPTAPQTRAFLAERASVSRALGLEVQVVEARDSTMLESAFDTAGRGRAEALMVLADVMFITHRARIAELAARSRLPAVYFEREFVDAGGLMFYGASLVDMYTRAAVYADRILKGTRPADLPVEQPTKLELAINLRAAKALGLAIPASVLARADYIVQ